MQSPRSASHVARFLSSDRTIVSCRVARHRWPVWPLHPPDPPDPAGAGDVHTMKMAVGNDCSEGSMFESNLVHRGKGAPLLGWSRASSRSASGSQQLPGFDMPENGSSVSAQIRVQSATLHYYGGKIFS